MEPEIIKILRIIADARPAPGFGPGAFAARLGRLLEGLPHAVFPGAGILIGASDPGSIPPGKVCLAAGLGGRGGALRRGADGNYLFAHVEDFPNPRELLGRTFGIYAPGTGRKLCEAEVDGVVLTKSGANIYFFDPVGRHLPGPGKAAAFAAHPADFRVEGGEIRCWDLSTLANAAAAVCLARRGLCCAWLSAGLAPDLPGLKMVLLRSFDASRAAEPFGLADAKNSLHQSLRDLPGRKPGEPLAALLGISAYANGNAGNRFVPEKLPVATLRAYQGFLVGLIRDLRAGGPRAPGAVHAPVFRDECARISALVSSARDFPDFLASGSGRLAAIFGRHGLRCSRLRAEDFARLRRKLAEGGMPGVKGATAAALAGEAARLVRACLPPSPAFDVKPPGVVSLLLGNAAAFSVGTGKVFLSPDKAAGDIERALMSELLFVAAQSALGERGYPEARAAYLADGLRTHLLSKLCGGGIAAALGLSGARHEALLARLPEIRKKVALELTSDFCGMHAGRYHRYMKPRPAESYASPEELRFLAAYDAAKAAKSGLPHE